MHAGLTDGPVQGQVRSGQLSPVQLAVTDRGIEQHVHVSSGPGIDRPRFAVTSVRWRKRSTWAEDGRRARHVVRWGVDVRSLLGKTWIAGTQAFVSQ